MAKLDARHEQTDVEHERERDAGVLLCRCAVGVRDPRERLQCFQCGRRIHRARDGELRRT